VWAGKLASRFDLPLNVVSVVAPNHSVGRRAEAQATIERVQTALRAEGVNATGRLVEGRPDQAILAAAESSGADLIVVGSHGRTGLDKMLMGSVSEKILNQADCAVLVAKAV
jgi:nucleotide-binding universal stress UspA family protein